MADQPSTVRAQRLSVPRGQAIDISLDIQIGSPGALLFTLKHDRNCPTALFSTTEIEYSSPSYVVTVPSEQTNREPRTYWWDVWDTETPRLLALGSLQIQAVVRLP